MASRLETKLSSKNKQKGGGNLKNSDEVEPDNVRNNQTF